MYFQHFLSR